MAKGSWEHEGTVHTFAVEDRNGGGPTVPVTYRARCPTRSARAARSSIDVRKEGAGFVGEQDSLVTKCPSKFTAEPKTSSLSRACSRPAAPA